MTAKKFYTVKEDPTPFERDSEGVGKVQLKKGFLNRFYSSRTILIVINILLYVALGMARCYRLSTAVHLLLDIHCWM
jgi:hypothetical protein